MDPSTKDADRALEEYRESLSQEGRFLTYCRGRSRHFWMRQAIVLLLFPVVFLLGGIWIALAAAAMSILGETIDCLVLSKIGKRKALGDRMPLAYAITTVTGGLQALTQIFGIAAIFILGDGETRTLAGAICFAGTLDAALLYSVHRAASIVRIVIYLLGLVTITFQDYLRTGGNDPSLFFDTLAVLFLLYVCWAVVRHVLNTKRRRSNMRMATLENARELAHANAALVQSRRTTRRLAMVAERANDSVIITGRDGEITWVNQAFSRMTGYSFVEAVGRNVCFLNGPQTEPEISATLNGARSEARPMRLEIVNHRKDGRPIWVEVNMCPLFDDEGELLNMVSIERDISEAKERERALAEARREAEESVRARHNFLTTMSHEIRTPMNGVIGTTDLLLDTDLDPQQLDLVKTIGSSGETLLAIINDILDFSKLEAGRLEVETAPFAPGECFRSAIRMVQPLAEAKDLSLDLVLPASLPETLVGDCRRLGQVLLNLLGNAIKFTETGGIRLEVSVHLEQETCDLLIAVRDTGIGIPADKLDRIFESFVQADSSVAGRFGGTGLGLSISRLLMNAMGGDISVASTIGKGTVFFVSISLPIATQAVETEPSCAVVETRPKPQGGLDGLKILVAEDNRTNSMLLERIFAGSGVEVVFAANGREAIDLFQQTAPQIVLMDVHMPILDGLHATRRIREIETEAGDPKVPIIALTANAFPEDRDLCLAAGMDDVVTKPFRKRDLFDAIGSVSPRSPVPPGRRADHAMTLRSG